MSKTQILINPIRNIKVNKRLSAEFTTNKKDQMLRMVKYQSIKYSGIVRSPYASQYYKDSALSEIKATIELLGFIYRGN